MRAAFAEIIKDADDDEKKTASEWLERVVKIKPELQTRAAEMMKS